MADIISSAIELITPVFESAMIIAGHYTKSCGRSSVTAIDMQYAMRYCARTVVGKHLGTLFPELQDDDDDAASVEEVDEDEYPFTRYSGEDPQMISVNEAYDTWKDWVPYSPVEIMLKNAIDNS